MLPNTRFDNNSRFATGSGTGGYRRGVPDREMSWAAVTIMLAVCTLLAALRTASLWWKASRRMPRTITHIAGSEDHVLQMEGELAEAGLLNARAALWSGATAVLSALTAICGALGSWI